MKISCFKKSLPTHQRSLVCRGKVGLGGFTRSVKNGDAQSVSSRKTSPFSTAGFTLVEMMITIGLFTVIMTIGIGAILGVNSTQRKTQSMRAVVDSLSFVMEDMARSMRLGELFYCKEAISPISFTDVNNQATSDGSQCPSIAFEPYWDRQPVETSNQIVYFITEIGGRGVILKKDNTNTSFSVSSWSVITPPEIDIDTNRSGFYVSNSQTADSLQPKIKIVLTGSVRVSGSETEFNMQTTVSQRLLDL